MKKPWNCLRAGVIVMQCGARPDAKTLENFGCDTLRVPSGGVVMFKEVAE